MAPVLSKDGIEVAEYNEPPRKFGWHPEPRDECPCCLPSQFPPNDLPPAGDLDERYVPQRPGHPFYPPILPIGTHCFPLKRAPTSKVKSLDAEVASVERGGTTDAIEEAVLDQLEDILDKRSKEGGPFTVSELQRRTADTKDAIEDATDDQIEDILDKRSRKGAPFTVSELQKRTPANENVAGDTRGRISGLNAKRLDSEQLQERSMTSPLWERPFTSSEIEIDGRTVPTFDSKSQDSSETPALASVDERELAAAGILAEREHTTYTPTRSVTNGKREMNDPDDPSIWVVNDLVARLSQGRDDLKLPIGPQETWTRKMHSPRQAQRVLPEAVKKVCSPVNSTILVIGLAAGGTLSITAILTWVWFKIRKRQSRNVLPQDGFQGGIPEVKETPPTGRLGRDLETVEPDENVSHVSGLISNDDDVDKAAGKKVSFSVPDQQEEPGPGMPIVKDFENDTFSPSPVI